MVRNTGYDRKMRPICPSDRSVFHRPVQNKINWQYHRENYTLCYYESFATQQQILRS
uniref:Uncharacterized protein n=1 Tax=Anguilla anguilla TaxID=7936 RepID=A0A0E9S0W7_ANGAN